MAQPKAFTLKIRCIPNRSTMTCRVKGSGELRHELLGKINIVAQQIPLPAGADEKAITEAMCDIAKGLIQLS